MGTRRGDDRSAPLWPDGGGDGSGLFVGSTGGCGHVSINDASKIHHPNERIILPYFVEGVERMKRILLEFATAP